MNVAIIPARGGSKRILRKNIKEFLGKPIIFWSIETALQSGCFDRVIVSTDDEEIAALSRRAGAETPFVRPAELANDTACTLQVVSHSVSWLSRGGEAPDYACCIYPTAPLLRCSDVRAGFDMLVTKGADYVITCCDFEFPVRRAIAINDEGFVSPEFPEFIDLRSQDLKPLYHDAGQMYWGTATAYQTMRPFFGNRTLPLLIPRLRAQDIDDEQDWDRAEFLKQWLSGRTDDQT